MTDIASNPGMLKSGNHYERISNSYRRCMK